MTSRFGTIFQRFRESLRKPTKFEALYFKFLVDTYRYVEFKGMGISHQVPLRLELLDLYVTLKVSRPAITQAKTSEATATALELPMVAPELVDLIDDLGDCRAAVVLGDPGSGKTTFLKRLTLELAGAGRTPQPGGYVPYLMPLSAYAQGMTGEDISLADFIPTYLNGRGFEITAAAQQLKAHLSEGRACLLLDGLDEISDIALRRTVAQRVEDFARLFGSLGNAVIVTSRIVGYDLVRLNFDNGIERRIAEFRDEDVTAFVDRWTRAVETAASGRTPSAATQAEAQRKDLLRSVRANSGIRSLAKNPLLLTIIALMKRADIELPQRRVELYHKSIDSLLKHWNYARSLGKGAPGVVDVLETGRILAQLALWMHERGEGLVLVDQAALEAKLRDIFHTRGYNQIEVMVSQFLREVRDTNSVLIERGFEQFGFAHLSFQEYLAAVGLVLGTDGGPEILATELRTRLHNPVWWEVGLLAIGYVGIIQQRDKVAGRVLQELLAQDGKALVAQRLFAGQAVTDSWPAGVAKESCEAVLMALQEVVTGLVQASPAERLEAADLSAWLELPFADAESLLGMPFCFVPAGRVELAYDGAFQPHDVPYDFWVARFPVTVRQFTEFRAGGYSEDRFWSAAGLRWRNDVALDHEAPLKWSFRTPSRPACAITYHEAAAYAAWADEQLHTLGLLDERSTVVLPNEVEWVKAARGGAEIPRRAVFWRPSEGPILSPGPPLQPNNFPRRSFPMGEVVDGSNANCFAIQRDETSVVGCFPAGVGPYGAEELAGNVWEWTRTLWGENWRTSSFPPPYDPDDGREDASAGDEVLRMVKGGSYSTVEETAHLVIDYRTRNSADGRYLNHGFRVAIVSEGKTAPQAFPASDPWDGAVFIDLDGTLVNSAPAWEISEAELLDSNGRTVDPSFQVTLEGLTLDDRLSAMIGHYDIDLPHARLREQMEQLLPQHLRSMRSMPGAAQFVGALASRDVPMALVSNSSQALIEGALAGKRWAEKLTSRISGEDVSRGKPDPMVYHRAATLLGVDPSACIAVEDTEMGICSAVRAGMIGFGVSGSAATRERLRRHTDRVYPSLIEALPALLELLNLEARPAPKTPR